MCPLGEINLKQTVKLFQTFLKKVTFFLHYLLKLTSVITTFTETFLVVERWVLSGAASCLRVDVVADCFVVWWLAAERQPGREKEEKIKRKENRAGWCKWLIFIRGGVREFSKV